MAEKRVFGNDGPGHPDLPMSTFDKTYTNNLTARVGRAYPCFVDLVPPHSTAHITPHAAFDMMPTVSPIQASIHCHISYYKIPLRILMRSYEDFFSRVGNHKVPFIKRPVGWCETGSLADYLGIPSQTFRPVRVASSLNFGRRGYIQAGQMLGKDLSQDLFLKDLFSSHLSHHSTLNLPDNAMMNAMETVVPRKLYNGVIQLPYVVRTNQTVNNSAFGSYYLRLLAVRATNWSPESAVHYNVPGLDQWDFLQPAEFYDSYKLIEWSSDRIAHDTTPSSGVSPENDYANLEPGQYALESTAFETVTLGGYSYRKYRFALRLSDSFLADLNGMIDRAESGQKVFLILAWSTYPSVEDLFGSNEPLPGSHIGTVALGVNGVQRFDNAVLTGTADKERVSQIVTGQTFQILYPGLGHGGNCSFAFVANSDDENPFCSYDGEDPKLPVNAFSFRAYEFIHNYFFRNQRVTPFKKLNPDTGELEDTYNQFITNDGDGADETTPVDFFQVPYEFDMFTQCQKTPQFGNAPLVGITTNDESDTADILMHGTKDGQPFDFTIKCQLSSSAAIPAQIVGITNYEEIANQPSVMRLNEAIRYGISINDFRSVNAFQIMQERFLKAGYCYPDLVQEFFNVRPPVGENYPEYLGGVTRPVSISKIQNVAKSADAALGEFAGTGSLEAHGERVECFCEEWSVLMGLCWFSVTPIYSQKIDKHFLYSHYLDFYNPQLASIGPQPVPQYLLAPLQMPHNDDGTIDVERLAATFGYNRPWYDLVSKQDEAHGEFRGSMHSYLLQRLFSEAPELGEKFLYIDSADLTDIYSYIADTDKFFGAILHEYYLKMPLPKVSLPRII